MRLNDEVCMGLPINWDILEETGRRRADFHSLPVEASLAAVQIRLRLRPEERDDDGLQSLRTRHERTVDGLSFVMPCTRGTEQSV